jgi:hypothetical protein
MLEILTTVNMNIMGLVAYRGTSYKTTVGAKLQDYRVLQTSLQYEGFVSIAVRRHACYPGPDLFRS